MHTSPRFNPWVELMHTSPRFNPWVELMHTSPRFNNWVQLMHTSPRFNPWVQLMHTSPSFDNKMESNFSCILTVSLYPFTNDVTQEEGTDIQTIVSGSARSKVRSCAAERRRLWAQDSSEVAQPEKDQQHCTALLAFLVDECSGLTLKARRALTCQILLLLAECVIQLADLAPARCHAFQQTHLEKADDSDNA